MYNLLGSVKNTCSLCSLNYATPGENEHDISISPSKGDVLTEKRGFRAVIEGISKCIKCYLFTVVRGGGGGQISTLGSVNPFFPSFTRTGFSVLVCQTSICPGKTKHKQQQH